MDLPAGHRFRAPIEDDLEAVADVLLADQRADGLEPVLDARFIRQIWSRLDFDLAGDAWVVTEDSGGIVAYGQVRREEPDIVGSWAVVHPEHRGRGIGAALFERIENRASALLSGQPTPRFQHSITAVDEAAASIARGHGLHPVRHYWHMQIDLAGPPDRGSDPDSIDIDTIDPERDLPAVYAVLDAAFADDPGDHPEPFDRWASDLTADPSYDPTLWLMAREAGVPVGVLTASAGDDGGWVEWLAILGSHRGRGIGSAMLHRTFRALAVRGQRRVMLTVNAENPTGATGVYERAGMRVVNRWDLWERVGPAPAAGARSSGQPGTSSRGDQR